MVYTLHDTVAFREIL